MNFRNVAQVSILFQTVQYFSEKKFKMRLKLKNNQYTKWCITNIKWFLYNIIANKRLFLEKNKK